MNYVTYYLNCVNFKKLKELHLHLNKSAESAR